MKMPIIEKAIHISKLGVSNIGTKKDVLSNTFENMLLVQTIEKLSFISKCLKLV